MAFVDDLAQGDALQSNVIAGRQGADGQLTAELDLSFLSAFCPNNSDIHLGQKAALLTIIQN
jgi:hypothetical protein